MGVPSSAGAHWPGETAAGVARGGLVERLRVVQINAGLTFRDTMACLSVFVEAMTRALAGK